MGQADKTCDVIVIGSGGIGINTEPKSSNEKLLPGARDCNAALRRAVPPPGRGHRKPYSKMIARNERPVAA
jgi:hypothetical protein